MSVLIKRIDTNNSGGSSKGYPPGNITLLGESEKSNGIYIDSYSICINWKDPDDIVVGDKTLSKWYSTTVIVKEGSVPISINDGSKIYSNTKWSDNAIARRYLYSNFSGKTYYFRFFICSTDGIYNMSSDMIYSITIPSFDSILKNNTWEQIAIASKLSAGSSLWKVGDEIDITLSGDFNETVTMQIWDFNHRYYGDGICFGMKNLMKDYQAWGVDDYNINGWKGSGIRSTMQTIFNSMPSDLQKYIKETGLYTAAGFGATHPSGGESTNDKIFIPGFTEVFGSTYNENQSSIESNQRQFPIFTDDNSRIKKLSNGSGNAYRWWTRSPQYGYNQTIMNVETDGKSECYGGSSRMGICFCFCV